MKNILLIDDNPEMVSSLTKKLVAQGLAVFSGDRMDTALRLFTEHRIDLIITDFHIAQGSGRRLAYEIRKLSAQVPIFLITGTPFVREEDFTHYGFKRVFLKPFLIRDLMNEVKRELGGGI